MSHGHYQVTSYPVYRHEKLKTLCEKQESTLFQVLDESHTQDLTAVVEALRWVKWDFCQIGSFDKFLYVGAVKVWRYDIAPLLETGQSCSGTRTCIFEWKCDWPGGAQAAHGRTSHTSEVKLAEVAALTPADYFIKSLDAEPAR